MRNWLRRWLGVVDVTPLSDRLDAVENFDGTVSHVTKSLGDRITALETSTKSATTEKPATKRTGGWSSQKRAAQKDAEWGH